MLLISEVSDSCSGVFVKNESIVVSVNSDQISTSSTFMSGQQFVKCFPNPFTEKVTIEFYFIERQQLDINVYDLTGRKVRNIFHGDSDGQNKFEWDGTDENNRKVLSGIYLINVNGYLLKVLLSN